MSIFKDKPIRQKLMTGMLITSSVVLLIACAIYFMYEYASFRRSLLERTRVLAEMCASNSTAALAFRNSADATSVLSALRADQYVVSAVLLNNADSVFATYPADLSVQNFQARALKPGFHFGENGLEGVIPVTEDGKQIGLLYISSTTRAIYERLELYALTALGVIVFSLLISYLLSMAIQRNISKSILSLVRTAEVVSQKKDYAIRATKYDNDEIGVLTTTFNNMLHEIEKQNIQITSFNQNLEAEVRARTRELETAYEEMEAFSYMVSHDLSAPLRKIDMFVDLYLQRDNKNIDPEGQQTFEKVTTNIDKMRTLISDLLAFAQLGKRELEKVDIDMKELVSTVFEDQKKTEDPREIEFLLCDIPNAHADRVTMSQVWVNLISNALKYTRKREVAKIEIGAEQKDNSVVYHIQDNGVGFDMNHYDKLFSAFNRLHSEKDFQGTGIGLAIVHRIISKHGGKVWAESLADKGAKFYFSIPK
jgi:signal transduction histidine kinase